MAWCRKCDKPWCDLIIVHYSDGKKCHQTTLHQNINKNKTSSTCWYQSIFSIVSADNLALPGSTAYTDSILINTSCMCIYLRPAWELYHHHMCKCIPTNGYFSARCRHHWQGQVITPHNICGMQLLDPALDTCFWHTSPQLITWLRIETKHEPQVRYGSLFLSQF